MDPTNYAGTFADVPNPVQSFAQGAQLGSGIVQLRAQQDALELARQQAAQQQQDLQALATKANPTAHDFAGMVIKYPALKDSLKQSWDQLSTEQKDTKLAAATPVLAAALAGRNDVVLDLMKKQGEALRNSGGSPQEIQANDTMTTLFRDHPEFAKTIAGLHLAGAMGPDKFAAAFGDIGKENRAAEQGPADLAEKTAKASTAGSEATIKAVEAAAAPEKVTTDIKNIKSQIADRAGRLALDQDKLASEIGVKVAELRRKPGAIDLPASAEKIINDSASNSAIARQSGAQLTDLAEQLTRADPNAFAAAPLEFLKKVTGNQGYITALRQEYVRLRAGETTKLLPPGPASDRDIEIAMKGFPSETASPELLVPFLRGMAKLKGYEAQVEDARGEWANAVGSLAKTGRDIEIGGVQVPSGTTFSDFLKKTIKPLGAIAQPTGTPTAAADTRTRLLQTYGQ